MRNGANERRKASRLSTGTSKTETFSDLQDRQTDGQTSEEVTDADGEQAIKEGGPAADIPGFNLSLLGEGEVLV